MGATGGADITCEGQSNPVIAVDDNWPRVWKLGTRQRVLFSLAGPVPIRVVEVDLIGDGQDGTMIVGDDLRHVSAVWLTAMREGSFQLQLRVQDACSRIDRTGTTRTVEVRP